VCAAVIQQRRTVSKINDLLENKQQKAAPHWIVLDEKDLILFYFI
jgi:hypothetical protein